MPYIGHSPEVAQRRYESVDDISGSFNGSTTSFALQVGGVTPAPFPVASENVLISVGGVIQEPDGTGTNGFQLTGTNIVFSSAPAAGESFFGVILAGADYVTAGHAFPDGDSAGPSITFSQDLDTGVFRAGSGAIGFGGNGSEHARLDGSGRLLVGTSSGSGEPIAAFQGRSNDANDSGIVAITKIGANPSGSIGELRFATGSDFNKYYGMIICASDGTTSSTSLPGVLRFSTTASGSTAPTEAMRIDNQQRVGIGTTAPDDYYANKLVVDTGSASQSGITIVSDSSNQGMFAFADGTSGADRYRGFLDYNHSDNSLAFGTSGSEAMRLDSSGRLGIASNSPDAELHVGGSEPHIDVGPDSGNRGKIGYKSDDLFFGTSSSSGEFIFKNNVTSTDNPADSGTAKAKLESNGGWATFCSGVNIDIANSQSSGNNEGFIYARYGSTGLGAGTNSFRVYTNGNVQNTNNSYGSISDQNLKENIVDATSQWDDIKALQVRKYNFREATGHQTHTQLGLIAQEAETVSPGLVVTTNVREGETVLDADGNQLESIKAINYSVLYMKAVKALQEAQTRIESLETQNTAQQTTIGALETQNTAQQTTINDLLARVTALEAA